MQYRRATLAFLSAASILAAVLVVGVPESAQAGGMTCRKVVAATSSGEGRNAAEGSRIRCADDEFLTGGTCYPSVRPEEDGSCQTAAMGIIQVLADHPDTTRGAFFTCMQTSGTDCPVQERTQAMAICCKFVDDDGGSD